MRMRNGEKWTPTARQSTNVLNPEALDVWRCLPSCVCSNRRSNARRSCSQQTHATSEEAFWFCVDRTASRAGFGIHSRIVTAWKSTYKVYRHRKASIIMARANPWVSLVDSIDCNKRSRIKGRVTRLPREFTIPTSDINIGMIRSYL